MKDKRVYFENGKIRRDNITYLAPKMPPEFKKLADNFFAEVRRLQERGRDGKATEEN